LELVFRRWAWARHVPKFTKRGRDFLSSSFQTQVLQNCPPLPFGNENPKAVDHESEGSEEEEDITLLCRNG
jgi:hypothetical protein